MKETVDFGPFGSAVKSRYDKLKKGELYTTDADKDEIWNVYLNAFPEGSNPTFRERTEHDCSCCKNFIRNVGQVVGIIDDEICNVWEIDEVGYPYDTVAAALNEYMQSRTITGIYRTPEVQYGAEVTPEHRDGKLIRWNHFSGKTNSTHKMTGANIGPFKSKTESAFQVMSRGLNEITDEATAEVLDLMSQGALYKGDEFKPAVMGFKKLQKAYRAAGNKKEVFLWQNVNDRAAVFRNTAIGTLLVDLSEGTGIEDAVGKFESKVAGENYQRPTALITNKMIEKALVDLDSEGLRESIDRRHAVLSDVSVTDVLYVDNSVKPHMKDALAELLSEEVVQKDVDIKDALSIPIADFLSTVAPTANEISLLLENPHQPNLMTLTAPVHAGAPSLFKWDNGFAWSYSGDLADSTMRKQVQAAGGRVDGVFRFTHSWNYEARNASLMDLHVFMPASGIKADNPTNDQYGINFNERVGWNNRNHNGSGGTQDVDYVQEAKEGYIPVENITFPSHSRMPDGEYICKIHNWNARSPNNGGFKAEIEFGGQVFQYEHVKPLAHKKWITVAVVTKKGSSFSIEHKLDSSASQQNMWGLKTQQLARVDSIVVSPNHWGNKPTGNKHWFFILKDCINPDPVRGIYNEYLKADLSKHRKVLEVLGAKTKAPFQEDQMSGLGFSSTKRQAVTALVTAGTQTRAYSVKF